MVDVDRIYSEFLQDFDNLPDDDEDPDIINLVLEQIEFCDMISKNQKGRLLPKYFTMYRRLYISRP